MLEIYFGDAIAALPVLESVALYLVEVLFHHENFS
jgi:hypothetical protein